LYGGILSRRFSVRRLAISLSLNQDRNIHEDSQP
jgi:hypothetical protein